VDEFVQAIRDNNYTEKGFSSSMYGTSKLCEIAYTLQLARQLRERGVMVNACCPGWCASAPAPSASRAVLRSPRGERRRSWRQLFHAHACARAGARQT